MFFQGAVGSSFNSMMHPEKSFLLLCFSLRIFLYTNFTIQLSFLLVCFLPFIDLFEQ